MSHHTLNRHQNWPGTLQNAELKQGPIPGMRECKSRMKSISWALSHHDLNRHNTGRALFPSQINMPTDESAQPEPVFDADLDSAVSRQQS
eukprot:scaffold23518_cov225-Skeletonema_marinoi.AAC.7